MNDETRQLVLENLRLAQDHVRFFIATRQYRDAVRLLLRIIDYAYGDGKITLDGNDHNTFVARSVFDCYCYIKRGRNPSLTLLLDTLVAQLSTLSDDRLDLKRYLLYKQHIGAFELNDAKTVNTTFEYVVYTRCVLKYLKLTNTVTIIHHIRSKLTNVI